MNIKMKELPISERPYEKLKMYGAEMLTNSELLAIIIKNGTKEYTAIDLANNVLKLNENKEKEDLSFLQDISITEFMKIKGIGEKTAIKVIEYFRNNLEYAMVLRSMFQIIDNKVNDNNESNGTVCFTGAMDNPRKYYEEIALQKHFTPVNSVSKDLTYLVVADLNSNSSKMQKARKYEINIITVEEFMAL